MVGIAQLVSAPDCGSGGPGFESLYPPFRLWAIAKLFIVETSVNWKHVKTKRCCQKETRNGANTRIEQHLKGIMLAQICSKNRHKRTVEEKNEKI